MSRILLLFCFLTFSVEASAQLFPPSDGTPSHLFYFEATDGTAERTFFIGMRGDATDGADTRVDVVAPPPPPSGSLNMYIEGGGASMWEDYRAISDNISQFYLVIDPVPNPQQDVVLRWDNTAAIFEEATIRVKHLFPGQPCFDLDMATVDSLDTGFLSEIPGSFFDTYGLLIEMALHDGDKGKMQMTACEDAFVQGGSSQNYGGADSLRVQQSTTEQNQHEALIQFDFGAMTDSIISASLQLYPLSVQGSPQQKASLVDENWTEDGLNWMNKPAAGEQLGSWIPVEGMVTSIDVTDQARSAKDSQGILSVLLESIDAGDDKWVTYASRENDEFAYRPVIEIITDKSSSGTVSVGEEEGLPQEFQLLGNYPNPFNPTTNVVLNLRENAMVSVAVFDLLGRQMLTVPAQMMLSGQNHQIQLDASSLTSGTYLYRVTAIMPARTEVQFGQMLLVK